MLIRFFNGKEDIEVNSPEAVMEYVKCGQLEKNTRVFDAESSTYKRLGEVKEVEDLALIPEHNYYLNMNVQRILNLRKQTKSKKDTLKSSIVTSSVFTGIGLFIYVAGVIQILDTIQGSSFEAGTSMGIFLGKQAVYAFIWLYLFKKARENKNGVPLIVVSVIYFASSIISFI